MSGFSAHAQSAGAQDAAASSASADQGETSGLGDIIVTAQRRSERLQDVPVAITAVTPESAQQLGLRNLRDIKLVVPGTDFAEGTGFAQLYIRGIGQNFATPGVEAPVSVYLDGAYLQRTAGYNSLLDIVDPGTIEVLRGPQGTLYGRNATGGVIRLNAALPTSKFEGRVLAEYGRFDHKQIDGMLNLPVSETLSVRFAGRYLQEDGYIRNLATGNDIGGGRSYTMRGTVRWQPNDGTDIVAGVEYQKSRWRRDIDQLAFGAPLCLVCQTTGNVPAEGFYETNQTEYVPFRNRVLRTYLRATFSTDNFDITSLSTFLSDKSIQKADNDYVPADAFAFEVRGVGGKTYSQELQVASHLDGRFNYIFGVNYLYDKAFFDLGLTGSDYAGVIAATGDGPGTVNNIRTESVSAFVEGNYKLTDQIKVTFGGRYTYDKRTITGDNNAGFELFGLPDKFTFGGSFRAFTPRFVLAWDNGPTNIYYSFTRGFKAGGLSTPATSPAEALRPEKIFNHEIGIKNTLMGGMLRTALSVFYYKNKDLQTQIIDATAGGSRYENAGGLEGYGAEFEATLHPTEGLTLGTAIGYLHTEFFNYDNASQVCVRPFNPAAPGAVLFNCPPGPDTNLNGVRGVHAPKLQASLTASYEFPIGTWKANVAGAAQYRSSFDFAANGGGQLHYDRQSGYTIANFSGYISPPGDNIRLGAYIDNAFGQKYAVYRSTSQPYGLSYQAGKPATYGVRAEYRF
ncbi:TonB-dependent receptor [Sphingobium sp. AN558]|uniref:TonB-dependent receptor n=1 Tax=Sphingobium sp. AN558 TaxID=3133442 RepID=UPI0030C0168F